MGTGVCLVLIYRSQKPEPCLTQSYGPVPEFRPCKRLQNECIRPDRQFLEVAPGVLSFLPKHTWAPFWGPASFWNRLVFTVPPQCSLDGPTGSDSCGRSFACGGAEAEGGGVGARALWKQEAQACPSTDFCCSPRRQPLGERPDGVLNAAERVRAPLGNRLGPSRISRTLLERGKQLQGAGPGWAAPAPLGQCREPVVLWGPLPGLCPCAVTLHKVGGGRSLSAWRLPL